MKLGCNYSVELIDLLNKGGVDVDYIKIALDDIFEDHYEIAKAAKPIMVHYMGHKERATMLDLDKVNFQWINEKIDYFKSPITALHCYVEMDDFETNDPSYEEVFERLDYVVGYWKDKMNVPLTIENYPYSAYYDQLGNHRLTAEPKIFHELCEKLDIDITLDIGHAKVCAAYQGKPFKSYLSEFPLHRVKELHVNGTIDDPEYGVKDKHIEMVEEDYPIIEWLIGQCPLEYLTLEYGGIGPVISEKSDRGAIERQLKRLQKIIWNSNA